MKISQKLAWLSSICLAFIGLHATADEQISNFKPVSVEKVSEPVVNVNQPAKNNQASSADSAQANLISEITQLKNMFAASTSPDEQVGIMRRIEELTKQLMALQSQNQSSVIAVQPIKPDPTPYVHPEQAYLIEEIIKLKNSAATTTSPEEQAAIMRQIDALTQKLVVLQSQSQPPVNTVQPPKQDPAQTVDPEHAYLIDQIIKLKNSAATSNSPEEQAAIMRQIDALTQKLVALQSQSQPPVNSAQPPKQDPAQTVDPEQAYLIDQIIKLKNLAATTNSPEEQATIMRQIDELTQKLVVLQSQSQTPANSVQPPKQDPVQTLDTAQADLIAQIIKLKEWASLTSSSEEQAAIMRKIEELTKQLTILQSQNQSSSKPVEVSKPDSNLPGNSDKNVAAASNNKNRMSIALNNNQTFSAKSEKKTITITWDGGPGILLQMSTSFGNAKWQDVANSEGKSSIEIPISNTGTFLRVIKRSP